MIERILAAWCRNMHGAPMWPVNGKYICRKCLRSHTVEWGGKRPAEPLPAGAVRTAPASMDVCA
jgi:hypothetical protein